jgi:hypothetical protein
MTLGIDWVSTDPAVRKIVEDILRGLGRRATLAMIRREMLSDERRGRPRRVAEIDVGGHTARVSFHTGACEAKLPESAEREEVRSGTVSIVECVPILSLIF